MIDFTCGACGGPLQADERYVGCLIRCGRCKASTTCPVPKQAGMTRKSSQRSMRWLDAAVLLLVGAALFEFAKGTPQKSVQRSVPKFPPPARSSVGLSAPPMRGDVPMAPAMASEPADPIQRLEHEVFEAAAGRAADPDLQRQYDEINERYFQNALPSIPVLWEPRLGEVGPLTAPNFVLEGITDGHTILLNTSLNGKEDHARAVLCHEIVHVSLFAATGHVDEQHGPAFQEKLRSLADGGAFKGIPASDAVKKALRGWLDRESSRLDGEFAAIAASDRQIELDRRAQDEAIADLNARIQTANKRGSGWPSEGEVESAKTRSGDLNRRISDVNARAASADADLQQFNREASRYNLMMAYPDGLDEEMLVSGKRVPQSAANR